MMEFIRMFWDVTKDVIKTVTVMTIGICWLLFPLLPFAIFTDPDNETALANVLLIAGLVFTFITTIAFIITMQEWTRK